MSLFTAAGAALVISWAMTPLIRAFGRHAGVIDVPNERSSHAVPTPRGGGIAILTAVFALVAVRGLLTERFWLITALATIVVALTGLVDDVRTLGAGVRFVLHCAAAAAIMLFAHVVLERISLPWGNAVSLGVLAIPVTLLFIVGLTNAYNFMDGINGIAGCEAVVAAGALAVLFLQAGDYGAAVVSVCTAAAAAGFLPWNFPSASIFMGDVGSGALGFLLAVLVVRYSSSGGFIAAILPLLPFIADTAVTLVRRIVRGERFYAAHRSHFYQRLNALGWSHASVTLLWAALAAGGAVVAIMYRGLSNGERITAVFAVVALHVVVAVAITLRERGTAAHVRATGKG